jgi:hypothetical protein
MGLEPATYTSEALVDQYLHGSYSVSKQLTMQTVYILQLDSVGTDGLPKEGFLLGNPNLLPNNNALTNGCCKVIKRNVNAGGEGRVP